MMLMTNKMPACYFYIAGFKEKQLKLSNTKYHSTGITENMIGIAKKKIINCSTPNVLIWSDLIRIMSLGKIAMVILRRVGVASGVGESQAICNVWNELDVTHFIALYYMFSFVGFF